MSKAADQFVELCKQSPHVPDVFEFLKRFEAISPREQLDVVLVDQYHRWQDNQAIPIGQYQARLSALTDEMAIPLFVEEYGYLAQRAAAPSPDEYVRQLTSLEPGAYTRLCEELDVAGSAETLSSNGAAAVNDQASSSFQIGRYEVVCSVGKGAFGEVFLAKDPLLDRNVAVKVPTKVQVELSGGEDQLLQEARLIAKVTHPNIVPVYDFGKLDDGGCYIVSKYIKGKDLRSETRKPMSHVEAAKITTALASALHAAHSAGIVHRDLKPANVILDSKRQPHLLDFGLAFSPRSTESDSSLVGTPTYMSPEQASCESGSVDGRSDIYSLGVMFYEMLTQQRPNLHATDVQPPRQLDDSIPKELEQICLKALFHSVSDRHNTAKDLADEIQDWLDQTSGSLQRHVVHENGEASSRWLAGGKLPTGPSIAVMPFQTSDDNPETTAFANGLCEEITAQLIRFKDLLVVGKNSTIEFQEGPLQVSDIAEKLRVDHVLTASVRRSSDRIRVTAEVVDATNGVSIWAKSFHGDLSIQDVFDIEDEIAQEVAATVGLPAGVIANARVARKAPAASIDVYDVVTRYYHYRHTHEITTRAKQIRSELEELVAREPEYASAWATFAYACIDAVVFQFPFEGTAEDLLEKGGLAARKAVELDPSSSAALLALFRYEYHCGQFAEFERTVGRAIAANPNDTEMLIVAAFFFGIRGDMQSAAELANRAIALNPSPPHYYYLVGCWQDFASGDFESTLAYSNGMQELDFWKPVYQAVSLGHLDRVKEGQQKLAELATCHPNFMERFVAEEKIWHINKPFMQIFMEGFAKLGAMDPTKV